METFKNYNGVAIEKQDCNGWSNWETWNFKLWLDNNQENYRKLQENTKNLTITELSKYLADNFETFENNDKPDKSMVNFNEIAQAIDEDFNNR